MGNIGPAFISIVAGILGVTIVAVLVSQKANTSSVISSTGSAFSSIISAAVSPITGSSSNQFGTSSSTLGSFT